MILTIIQARMGSTRLHGKVLKPVLGKPLLWHLIRRLQHSKLIDKIVIATTTNKNDEPIVKVVQEMGIDFFRGSEQDVLDRYYKAAKQFGAAAVVHITADCPLVDPEVTDRVIKYYLDNQGEFDFVSNMHPATFPDGLDTSVYSFAALERAWREAKKPFQREHVTPYIWDQPEIFRIGNVENDVDLSGKERWTIDYAEDYEFIRAIYEKLYKEEEVFLMQDILRFLDKNPDIREINKGHLGTVWYTKHLDELKTIDKSKWQPK